MRPSRPWTRFARESKAWSLQEGDALLREALEQGYYQLGPPLNQRNELSRAIEIYERLLQEPVDLPWITTGLAQIRLALEQPEAAEKVYRTYLAQHPENLHMAAQFAIRVLCSVKREQEAIETLRKACASAPKDGHLRSDLALAHYLAGELDTAISEVEHAIELDRHHLGAVQRLVELLEKAQRPTNELPLWEKRLEYLRQFVK